MPVMAVQEIDSTKDYNFIYNKMLVAVALLQAEEYYLYFYDGGYNEKEVEVCLNSLKTLNGKLKQEKSE